MSVDPTTSTHRIDTVAVPTMADEPTRAAQPMKDGRSPVPPQPRRPRAVRGLWTAVPPRSRPTLVTTPPDDGQVQLAEAFAEVARSLLAEHSVEETLRRICSLAVETIDGCDHAGISLITS